MSTHLYCEETAGNSCPRCVDPSQLQRRRLARSQSHRDEEDIRLGMHSAPGHQAVVTMNIVSTCGGMSGQDDDRVSRPQGTCSPYTPQVCRVLTGLWRRFISQAEQCRWMPFLRLIKSPLHFVSGNSRRRRGCSSCHAARTRPASDNAEVLARAPVGVACTHRIRAAYSSARSAVAARSMSALRRELACISSCHASCAKVRCRLANNKIQLRCRYVRLFSVHCGTAPEPRNPPAPRPLSSYSFRSTASVRSTCVYRQAPWETEFWVRRSQRGHRQLLLNSLRRCRTSQACSRSTLLRRR